jgi:hypothetical protein
MRDPEMCFELGMAGGPHLSAFYFRNDYLGVEQWRAETSCAQLTSTLIATAIGASPAIRQTWEPQPALAGIRRGLQDKCTRGLVRSTFGCGNRQRVSVLYLSHFNLLEMEHTSRERHCQCQPRYAQRHPADSFSYE